IAATIVRNRKRYMAVLPFPVRSAAGPRGITGGALTQAAPGPLKPPTHRLRLTSVRVLAFLIAVAWAAGAVAACGTERQASAGHPSHGTPSTATPGARTPLALTAVSKGTTGRRRRDPSDALELAGGSAR